MLLVPGTKLGPYEIVSPLGAGGMGEVYRARDTRLERTVAIKILPEQVSKDPLRKQRFEREAKTISSLNLSSETANSPQMENGLLTPRMKPGSRKFTLHPSQHHVESGKSRLEGANSLVCAVMDENCSTSLQIAR